MKLLVSKDETFALGFFSPTNSSNRYVGIWYNKVSEQTVVWVANRDRPITNSSGILSVDETGNLILHEQDQSFMYWSTNVTGVQFCTSIDTITLSQPVKDGDILVSNGETFALGFFSPTNSSNRYVGIWNNKVSEQTVVWVANRDRPITNSSRILSGDETGNLVLHEQDQSFMFWSTNITGVQVNNVSTAQLLDSGNLVLFQGQNRDVFSWQSFDYPSNTFLPSMKLGINRKTGLNRVFTSWKSI
ncbi:hypothetical protein R6Q59_027800 [Mikania micrantha]